MVSVCGAAATVDFTDLKQEDIVFIIVFLELSYQLIFLSWFSGIVLQVPVLEVRGFGLQIHMGW